GAAGVGDSCAHTVQEADVERVASKEAAKTRRARKIMAITIPSFEDWSPCTASVLPAFLGVW
ncbi:MAG: hypothetical protein ACK53L_35860, partial [Pirellulaceae bacterium]